MIRAKWNLKLIGIVGTVAWLVVVAILAFGSWPSIGLDLNEIGDFLAGAFAPLAFFWFVLAFWQQSNELALQRQELELQREELKLQRKETARLADEAHRQGDAISANELHARRDTFYRLADFFERELNHFLAQLVSPLIGHVREEDVWNKHSLGDSFIIAKVADSGLSVNNAERINTCFSTEPRRSQARRYCLVFRRILDEAAKLDDDGLVRKEYEWSLFGEVYSCFCELMETRPHFEYRKRTARLADDAVVKFGISG